MKGQGHRADEDDDSGDEDDGGVLQENDVRMMKLKATRSICIAGGGEESGMRTSPLVDD